MNIERTLDAIRTAVGNCTAGEYELMCELSAEGEGWQMRAQELEEEQEDEDEDEN